MKIAIVDDDRQLSDRLMEYMDCLPVRANGCITPAARRFWLRGRRGCAIW